MATVLATAVDATLLPYVFKGNLFKSSITILCVVVKYIEAPSELMFSTVVENGSSGSVSLPCPFLIIVIGLPFSPTSDHGLKPLKSVTV